MVKEKFPEWLRKIKEESGNFWSSVYPRYTPEEKLIYWTDEILSLMRIQGETSGDEYSGFSQEWYETACKHEPSFDKLLAKIVSRQKTEISKKKLYERIGSSAPVKKSGSQKEFGKLLEDVQLRVSRLKALYAGSKDPMKSLRFQSAFQSWKTSLSALEDYVMQTEPEDAHLQVNESAPRYRRKKSR